MTAGARAALTELGPRWEVAPEALGPAELATGFGRTAPRLLDIGGGTGEATVAYAADHPEHDVLAVELHRPGIARLFRALEDLGLTNVRVAPFDVTQLLALHLEPGSLDHVRVLFPDPWPKRRHLSRRLVDPVFVHRVAELLPVGGLLHVATDWPDYADQVRAVLANEPRLRPRADHHDAEGGWTTTRPERPITTYERRGIAAGRPIADLVVERVPG